MWALTTELSLHNAEPDSVENVSCRQTCKCKNVLGMTIGYLTNQYVPHVCPLLLEVDRVVKAAGGNYCEPLE